MGDRSKPADLGGLVLQLEAMLQLFSFAHGWISVFPVLGHALPLLAAGILLAIRTIASPAVT